MSETKKKRGRPPLTEEEREKRRLARKASSKPKRRRGRPEKFSEEIFEKLICALKAGAPRKWAANALGLGESTVREWIRKGKNGDPQFVELAQRVEAAEFEPINEYHRTIHAEVARGNWLPAKWMLQSKLPEHYGNKLTVDQTVRTAEAEIDMSKLSDEELETLRRLHEKAQATEAG